MSLLNQPTEINDMKADLNYTTDGVFVTLLPNNNQAQEVYNTVYADLGHKIPVSVWDSVKHQIKSAGYTVRKVGGSQAKTRTDKELLGILSNDPLGLLN